PRRRHRRERRGWRARPHRRRRHARCRRLGGHPLDRAGAPARLVRPRTHRAGLTMFYRAAGIRHVNYQQTRQLWRLPFDRALVAAVSALLLLAPWLLNGLYLNSYLTPLMLWTSAALGLNLLMGGAGQVHLGYGAVMAIGASGTLH